MTIQQRIDAFVKLGNTLTDLSCSNFDDENHPFQKVLQQAHRENAWFTKENQLMALRAIAGMLLKNKLNEWTNHYPGLRTPNSKLQTIGLILAGNIPAVGFHDLLCVLISGNHAAIKCSSDDKVLLKWLADELMKTEPAFSNAISFVERMTDVDAVIATGSDNSARYFEYYFSKYPHIIRKNRNAVAVLNGDETDVDLKNLGIDIFSFFGLGCRNVSKLYVPENYDFQNFFKAVESFSTVMNHNKYMNNYDYHHAVFLLNHVKFLTNNFLIVKEDKPISTPVSVLNYEFYKDVNALKKELNEKKEKIQCIVTAKKEIENAVPFGKAQQPELWDYADGMDTMKFLLDL
ncbi:MAG: acyl-CoA reductase [Bacteroidia bacterium]